MLHNMKVNFIQNQLKMCLLTQIKEYFIIMLNLERKSIPPTALHIDYLVDTRQFIIWSEFDDIFTYPPGIFCLDFMALFS